MPVTDAGATAVPAIADALRSQRCILFLGAAVHARPPAGQGYMYPDSEGPPLGNAFSDHLARQVGFAERFPRETTNNLQRVSLFYEVERSRRDLVEEIRAAVQEGKRPSPVLRALASLSFPLIITTNYDQLFEEALRDAGKRPFVTVYDPSASKPTPDFPDASAERPFLFKIHGDVDTPDSIVITDEDYIQFILRMNDKQPYDPVPNTFQYRFSNWPTLFVGYSLIDYNLRLLFKTLRWKLDPADVPNTYSVDRDPDPLILAVWHEQRRLVNFISQDVWTFVPQLYNAVTGKEMPRS